MTDFIQKVNFKGGIVQFTGTGSPEGVVTAYTGNNYFDTSNSNYYEKASGDNTNTGWTLINASGGGSAQQAYAASFSTGLMLSATTLAPLSGIDISNASNQFTIGGSSITCNKAGTYQVTLSTLTEANSVASITVDLLVNSVSKAQTRYDSTVSGSGYFPTTSLTSIISLASNDIIEVSKNSATDAWRGIFISIVEII